MSDDYDSPWKEVLDAYFEPFAALLFPQVHRQIDWSRGYESLDKEFQQVVREAVGGTPSPLVGEGRGGGGTSCAWKSSPPTLTLPHKGGGNK